MRFILLLALLLGQALSVEEPVTPLAVDLAITGYDIQADVASMVVVATNRESSPVAYAAHHPNSPFVELSWMNDDAWVSQRIGMCGVGIQHFAIAPGASATFLWRIGARRPDPLTQVVSWKWIPEAWPIRAQVTFQLENSPNWWTAISEPAEIDDDLRAVLLHGVAARTFTPPPTTEVSTSTAAAAP